LASDVGPFFASQPQFFSFMTNVFVFSVLQDPTPFVGLDVGESVGLDVGESVGLGVGDSVGLGVGEAVGLSVGSDTGGVVHTVQLHLFSFWIICWHSVSSFPLHSG
jgi:hypothetical protein